MAMHRMWLTMGFCILSLFLKRDHQPAGWFTSSTGWVRYYMVNHGCRDSPNCDPVTDDVCDVGQWSKWSKCSATCSPLAERTRTRKCLKNTCSAKSCPGRRLVHVGQCNLPCCEGYPKWLEWGPWEKLCGKKYCERRTRECATCNRTMTCESLRDIGSPFDEEFKTCTSECPSHCLKSPKWSKWEKWSECSASCGGTRTRTRECKEDKRCPDGSDCVGEWKEVSQCNHKDCLPCKSKSQWKEWRNWSKCRDKCGRGDQSRKRKCKVDKKCPIHCAGERIETKSCFTWCCGNVKIGQWSDWSECEPSCTNGVSRRRRTCSAEGCRFEKKQCNGMKTLEIRKCTGSC